MKCHRNKDYLDFVRQQRSMISGREGCVAHHVRCYGHGGVGIKPSDYLTVPLTPTEHNLLHQTGEAEYFQKNNALPMFSIAVSLMIYLANKYSPEGVIKVLIELIEREGEESEKDSLN